MTYETYIVDYPETQRKLEDIDIKLLDQFLEFLFEKKIFRGEDLTELIDKINKYKISIQDPNRIGVSKKQIVARELIDQIYSSIMSPDPELENREYFSLLLRFQEASFRYYQENNRDHLIHSLRVFLLIFAIFRALDAEWINILKDFLQDLLEKLDISSESDIRMRLSSKDLWKISVRAASLMSLFHDIGIVPSRCGKLIEGLIDTIFRSPDGRDDLSIFSFQLELKEEYKEAIEFLLPFFEKLFKRFHPKHVELFQKLEEDFERLKKPFKNEDIKILASMHGSLSLFLVYILPIIKITLSGQSLKERLIEAVDSLILLETTIAIFAHDKENHITVSPLSEILIFADVSQEWDRIQYKKGKMTRYQRDEIKIGLHRCKNGESILSFYEGDQFEEMEELEKLREKFKKMLSDMRKKGKFGILISLSVNSDSTNIKNPYSSIFRCKFHSRLLDCEDMSTRDKIPYERFCRNCTKNTRKR